MGRYGEIWGDMDLDPPLERAFLEERRRVEALERVEEPQQHALTHVAR